MQYKSNIKILIDKRKLELLLRLGCPRETIMDAILNKKNTKKQKIYAKLTGDFLIDELLQTFVDIREFKNWGGNRKGAGRRAKAVNQLENHLDNQLENHLASNLEDIDIDKDIDYFNNPLIDKILTIYKEKCKNLVKLGKYARRDRGLREKIGLYLKQTECDLDYFARVCELANSVRRIGNINVDLKVILKNHEGFYNGKYVVENKPNIISGSNLREIIRGETNDTVQIA